MSGKLLGIARKAKPYAPMEELPRVAVTLDRGIDGDARGATPDRQVTVVAKADWDAACRDHGKALPWTTRRANLLVDTLDGMKRAGARFKIGALQLEVCEETEPCSRMEAASQGLRAALTPDWRGGVSCKVLTAGDIALGDPVVVVE
jgi:MOSC domain-containing protein YiiM